MERGQLVLGFRRQSREIFRLLAREPFLPEIYRIYSGAAHFILRTVVLAPEYELLLGV
jgi:hypothetical protein